MNDWKNGRTRECKNGRVQERKLKKMANGTMKERKEWQNETMEE